MRIHRILQGEHVGRCIKVEAIWEIRVLPQVTGERGNTRDWIFCHYWGKAGRVEKGAREFVRDKRYKLYDDGNIYDLKTDPLEEAPLKN